MSGHKNAAPLAAAVSGEGGGPVASGAYAGGMNQRGVMLVVAAVLLVFGLALGVSTVHAAGVDCGSAFKPSDADASMTQGAEAIAGTLVGATPSTTDYAAECDDARQQRNTYALVGLGLGVVVGAIAMVVPGTKPREPVV